MIGRDRFKNRAPKPIVPAPQQPTPSITQPPKPTQAKPVFTNPPKKQPPPFVSFEKVKALCGHEVDFGLFPEKDDKHRDIRRRKLTSVACAECRQKAHREATEATHAAAEERKRKFKGYEHSRLPDLSHFQLAYDGKRVVWVGTLFIPHPLQPEAWLEFKGESTPNACVFRFQEQLDKQWRKWAKENLTDEQREKL